MLVQLVVKNTMKLLMLSCFVLAASEITAYISALVLVTSYIVAGQRPSFAGTRPIGFPDTPNRTTTTPDPLGNRFGDGTPERLPIEANGDRDLIDRLSKLPIDKQPFWFINWQAYEQHRKNPQTYPQRPNAFVDPISNVNSGSANNGISTPSPGFVETEPTPTVVFNRFGSTTPPSQFSGNAGPSGNSNFNSAGNVYPSSVYPNSNANSNSNVYPNSNANINSNVYPTSNANINSNVYPNSNNANFNYPTANPNSNAYPNNNGNSNNLPAGNFNNPSGNSNSHVAHSSNFNTQSNTGTLKNGVTYFQTTQNYEWNTSWNTTNVGTKNLNKYP